MLTVGYDLQPLPGWATLTLDDGTQRVEREAAWVDDVLCHLVAGTTDLLVRGARLRLLLDAEASASLLLVEPDGDAVVVRVLDGVDEDAPEVFRTRTSARVFAAGVAQAAWALLARHGEAGYLEQWGEHPFPRAELARLQGLLGR